MRVKEDIEVAFLSRLSAYFIRIPDILAVLPIISIRSQPLQDLKVTPSGSRRTYMESYIQLVLMKPLQDFKLAVISGDVAQAFYVEASSRLRPLQHLKLTCLSGGVKPQPMPYKSVSLRVLEDRYVAQLGGSLRELIVPRTSLLP